MKAITVAMIVYCAGFAVLIFAISTYQRLKRNREMQALGASRSAGLGLESDTDPHPPSNSESPHGAPPARAA